MSAPVDTTTAPATTNGAAPHIAEGTTTAPTTTTTAAEPATTSAPAATSAQANNGPINDKDINHWKTRVNDLIHTSGKSEAAVANPKPWHESVFGCFTPVDSCLITCCVPCVTFGKVHHRLHHHGELKEFSFINTSCLLFCVSSCLAFIPLTLQRGDVRKKYGLNGDFVTDLALSCCCHCCSLVQMDKETAWQEKELLAGGAQYQNGEKMEYKATV